MRILYSFAWWLALPLVLLRLYRRGRTEPGYRQHVAERLGFFGVSRSARPCLWIHAVSVGETRAAEPLIQALLESFPAHDILLTHMTATGRATGAELFGAQPRVRQCYLPYDTNWMMGRFLRHFSPQIGILMETEIWPNLMAQSVRRQIPVVLANARMSERSLQRARYVRSLMAGAAGKLAGVAAQTHADAARLLQYGARQVTVTGSVKFDVKPGEAALDLGCHWREWIGTRPVLLCASTRDGEEALLLDALPALTAAEVLLIIVPRHPQRFSAVARMVADRGLSLVRRSEVPALSSLPPEVNVLLGDSMGEMFAYYAAADVAFIGGSLLPLGGQNLIEACAVGTPVLVGPHTFNFAAITEDAIAAGAAVRVASADDVMHAASDILGDSGLRRRMGEAAREFAQAQQGATARTLALVTSLLVDQAEKSGRS